MIKLPFERLRKKANPAIVREEFSGHLEWVNEILGTYRIVRFDSLGFDDVQSSNYSRMFLSGEKVFIENALLYKDQLYVQIDGKIVAASKNQFVLIRKNINEYWNDDLSIGDALIAKVSQSVYKSVDFNEKSKIGSISKGEQLIVDSIDWTVGGTPRIRTKKGYVSSNRENVEKG